MTRKPLIFSKINLGISSATIRKLMVKDVFCGDNFHLYFRVIYENLEDSRTIEKLFHFNSLKDFEHFY
jgi:hypothetical protein